MLLVHIRDRNSCIAVNALLSFSNLNASIKMLSSFVKAAMFVSINYVTNVRRLICKEYLTTALNIIYWLVCYQPLQNHILITSLAHR